jgi:hypothetical protein
MRKGGKNVDGANSEESSCSSAEVVRGVQAQNSPVVGSSGIPAPARTVSHTSILH